MNKRKFSVRINNFLTKTESIESGVPQGPKLFSIFINDNVDIQLLGEKIISNKDPVFLGIRFERHLTFKNQIEYMKSTCLKRINVLKVLSNKNWGLTVKL